MDYTSLNVKSKYSGYNSLEYSKYEDLFTDTVCVYQIWGWGY